MSDRSLNASPWGTSSTKTILVIGATGKQGSGLVSSLVSVNNANLEAMPYRILALTRTPEKQVALKQLPGVEVVRGDLNDEAGMETLFSGEGMGGIYGVFVCLTYPGLGKPADAELAQGKLAANLALKYQVRHLIYSSSELAPESKDNPAKMMIEAHVKELGAQHDEFKWTILRPAFFYENFDGLLGSVSECLFESSMDKGTKIQMVGGEDIGRVAGAVFEAGQEYHGATITVCGDCLTSKEVNAVHKKVMGRPLTRIPGFVGSVLRGMNKHAKDLIMLIEHVHQQHLQDPAGYNANAELGKRLHPDMLTFEKWLSSKGMGGEKREKGWNNLSLMDLVKGSS